MKEMNVYNFCMNFYKCKEIRLHVWTIHEDESETCSHKVFTDKFDSRLYNYTDAKVMQFECVKKGVIDIIAIRDMREEKDGE